MPAVLLVLAEIGEVIASFGAYLVAGVLLVWVIGLLVWVFQHIPFFGQNVADALQGFADNLHNQAQAQLDAQVQVLSDTVDFVTGSIQGLLRLLTNGAEWLGYQLGNLASVSIAAIAAINTAVSTLIYQGHQLANAVASLVTGAAHLAAQVAGILANTIPAAIARAVSVAESWATAELTKLRVIFGQAIDAARLAAAHAVSIESDARAAADVALRHAIDAAELDLEHTITGVEKGIRDTVAQDVRGIDQQLTGIREMIGPLEGATVVGLITTITAELTRLTRECIDPTCGYLSPQLPLLTALTDAGMLLAMGGLVREGVQDPQGTARAVVGLVNGVEGMVTGLFGELTGMQV